MFFENRGKNLKNHLIRFFKSSKQNQFGVTMHNSLRLHLEGINKK